MPTVIDDALKQYPNNVFPVGKMLNLDELTIPADVDFVIAQASDAQDGGDISDLGKYTKPNWSKQVQNAYNAKKLMFAFLTMRVDGNNYPMDFENPQKDRQLQGFLYSLKSRTYAGIALMCASNDSPAATMDAINHIGANLRVGTGKRVLFVTSRTQFESGKLNPKWSNEQAAEFAKMLQTALGSAEYSDWSLLIVGDYEVNVGAKVETPGNWVIRQQGAISEHPEGRNIMWEIRPREYVLWLNKIWNETYLGVKWPEQGTPTPDPQPDPEPGTEPEPVPGDTTLQKRIAIAVERIAAAVEAIAAFVVMVKEKLGWV